MNYKVYSSIDRLSTVKLINYVPSALEWSYVQEWSVLQFEKIECQLDTCIILHNLLW